MQVLEIPAFTVIGPTIRTTNAAEMSNGGHGKIGPLWGRFLGGEAAAIPKVIDQGTIYAVYFNYQRDETGAYDLTLGKAVQPDQLSPPNMRTLHVPAARYMTFAVSDSSPDAIKSAWLHVYTYFAQHPDKKRAFTYDFEQHSKAGTAIFIAIR